MAAAAENPEKVSEDGIEDAFDVIGEVWLIFTQLEFVKSSDVFVDQQMNSIPMKVTESVKTGLWVGDCFIYTNSVNRLNYYVGGEIVTVSHLDRTM